MMKKAIEYRTIGKNCYSSVLHAHTRKNTLIILSLTRQYYLLLTYQRFLFYEKLKYSIVFHDILKIYVLTEY
jgi:hypothetical protein